MGWDIGASEAQTPTINQTVFRFRDDDGNEITATWTLEEDEKLVAPCGNNERLRIQLSAGEDVDAYQYQLEFRKVGDPTWRVVPVQSP